MKPIQERSSKRSLKTAITSLQALDVLLNGVFARDVESADADGFPASSTGGGSGGKGSHSDRTYDHANREAVNDTIHTEVARIVADIAEIKARAVRMEKVARKLTAHDRSLII